MIFTRFNTNIQLNLNRELLRRAKDNPKADYIPNLIDKTDFMKLVDGELLHLGRGLSLSAFMEILKMGIKIVPYIGHNRTMIGANNVYFDIYLTGKDILKLMHRELYYGEGNLQGLPLDVSMYQILSDDNVLVPDVKEVFKYYAAYERHNYNIPPYHIDFVAEEERPTMSREWAYERVSVIDVTNDDIFKKAEVYSIATTGDVEYNPTRDWLYRLKRLFKKDPDSILGDRPVLPYFELWFRK